MRIIRRRKLPHDCDTKQIKMLAENEGLGTGSVIRCDKCGQRWLLYRPSLDSSSLERIDLFDYLKVRLTYQ